MGHFAYDLLDHLKLLTDLISIPRCNSRCLPRPVTWLGGALASSLAILFVHYYISSLVARWKQPCLLKYFWWCPATPWIRSDSFLFAPCEADHSHSISLLAYRLLFGEANAIWSFLRLLSFFRFSSWSSSGFAISGMSWIAFDLFWWVEGSTSSSLDPAFAQLLFWHGGILWWVRGSLNGNAWASEGSTHEESCLTFTFVLLCA